MCLHPDFSDSSGRFTHYFKIIISHFSGFDRFLIMSGSPHTELVTPNSRDKGDSQGQNPEKRQVRKKANMDVTRLARNTLLDDFIRQTRQLKLNNRLPGPRFHTYSRENSPNKYILTFLTFLGATFEMRKHLEIWGEKGIKDIPGYNSNILYKFIASARSFMGIYDHPAGSKLIHPLSYFWICFRIMSGLLIMFMCIESPAILAFYWNANSCAVFPTRDISLTIEVLFLCEIVLNFFVAYYDELSGVLYCRNLQFYENDCGVSLQVIMSMTLGKLQESI